LRRSGALAVALAALSFAYAPRARAVEKQHHIGVDPGLAILAIDKKDGPSVGAGFVAHWAYGLTDAWQVAVEGGWSIVSTGEKRDATVTDSTGKVTALPNNRPAQLVHGSAGIHYIIDVLRWVPYFGLHATGLGLLGGNLPNPKFVFGMTLAVGLDYQVTRAFTLGLAVRQHFPFSDFTTYPSLTHVLARAELVWGW
jgi:hypothetical protein